MKKNPISVKYMIAALAASALVLTAAGCSSQPANSSSGSAPESTESSQAEQSNEAPEVSQQSDEASIAVAGAMEEEGLTVVTGVLEDVAVNDQGKTVWNLRPQEEDPSAPTIKLLFDETASYDLDLQELANGVSIRVAYETPEKPDAALELAVVKAERVQTGEENSQMFEGTVKEITPNAEKPGEGQVLMVPVEGSEQQMEWLFNYSADTTFPTEKGIEDVKTGDRLNVVFNGVATRSIPPQSFALHFMSPDQPVTMGEGPAA